MAFPVEWDLAAGPLGGRPHHMTAEVRAEPIDEQAPVDVQPTGCRYKAV